MDFIVGLLGVLAAVAIPLFLQRAEHPKRELRFAIVPKNQIGSWLILIWSTSRADIPSALFDADKPVIFRFSSPIQGGPLDTNARSAASWSTPHELHLGPHLIHTDFFVSAEFTAAGPFNLAVDRSLIDVPIVEDQRIANTPQPRLSRAVERSKARARLSLRSLSVSILIGSFLLFVLGISLTLGGVKEVGTAFGGASLLLFPVGLILLLADVIRRLVVRLRRRGR